MLSAEHQAVVDALGTLPPRQREVLVLRYYGGMSEAEIADATGISRGTVKSTASRAMDAVQRSMAGRPGRGMSRERAERANNSAQRLREAPTERQRGGAVSANRGGGGRDGEAGAAERRLAEALRAQASLGARSSAASPAPAPVKPAVHKPATPKRVDRKPAAQKQRGPEAAWSATGEAGAARVRRRRPRSASPGRTGAGASRDRSTPRRVRAPGHGAPHGAGRRTRPRDDQLPTTKVATADPGQAEAPTTQQPSAHPAPRHRPRWPFGPARAGRHGGARPPRVPGRPAARGAARRPPRGNAPRVRARPAVGARSRAAPRPGLTRVTASAAPCSGSGRTRRRTGRRGSPPPARSPAGSWRACPPLPPPAATRSRSPGRADQGRGLPRVHRVATHAIGPGGDQPGHRTMRHDRGALPQDSGHTGGAERDPRRTDGDPNAGEGSASGTGQGQPNHPAVGSQGGGQRYGEECRREGKADGGAPRDRRPVRLPGRGGHVRRGRTPRGPHGPPRRSWRAGGGACPLLGGRRAGRWGSRSSTFPGARRVGGRVRHHPTENGQERRGAGRHRRSSTESWSIASRHTQNV